MDFLNLIAEAIQKGGWLGYVVFLLVFVGALLSGQLQSKREVKEKVAAYEKALVERDKRFDDMKGDRDEWRTKTEALTKTLEQLTDVLESAQGRGGKR